MCVIDYIRDRAQILERQARDRLQVLDMLLPHITQALTTAENLQHGSALCFLLWRIRSDVVADQNAAHEAIITADKIRVDLREVE